MKERFDEKYLKLGLTLFATAAAVILLFFALQNLGKIFGAVDTLVGIMMPFLYGLIMAYLLSPLYNLVTRKTYHKLTENWKNKPRAFLAAKVVATVISLIVLFAVFAAVGALLIPQIVKSIVALVTVMPDRLQAFNDWLTNTLGGTRYEALTSTLNKTVDNAYDNIMVFVQEKIMPNVGDYMGMVSQGVYMTLKTVMDIFIGVIAAVYFLNSKEKFKAQARKITRAMCSRQKTEEIFEFCNYTNRTFGGFITGNIIDSIVVGLICFLFMWILGIPYAALCSTIVAVTNLIPFFGPFIGAIPSAIIICIMDPIKALEFLIMILVLQQIDGNIVAPRILGGTTGLASFWVMFTIILAGGLFGIAGMILGVPVFAVFYHYFKRFTEKRLKRKGLDYETKDYEEFNKYNINRRDIL